MSTPLKTGCYDGDNFDLPVNLQTTKELNQLGTRSFKFIVKLSRYAIRLSSLKMSSHLNSNYCLFVA